MAARIHWLLKVIAFNANGIWRWRYELSKQLQNLHTNMALLSETYINAMRGSSIQIITFIRLTTSQEEKAFPIPM
jgi:hypothetical protein